MMEAIPSASGESPAADGIFCAIAYRGESFPDVARIKTNRMGDSWRATVPSSVSGALSVQIWRNRRNMYQKNRKKREITGKTAKNFCDITLEREVLPCSFLECPALVSYNEDEKMSKGGGAR